MNENLIATVAMVKQRRWDDYFMALAVSTSKMSYCKRLQVGAVAVREKRPILTGWNGTAPGEDNCCEEEIRFESENVGMGGVWEKVTKQSVSHAERNLIEWAARKGIPLEGASLYLTHAPCIECAKSIRNSGIVEVIYKDVYRNNDGLDFLYNIKVRRHDTV